MTTTCSYTVPGMSCAHCEQAVKAGVSRVAGVELVEVALESKVVTVRGHEISDSAVRDAIDEAGYEVA